MFFSFRNWPFVLANVFFNNLFRWRVFVAGKMSVKKCFVEAGLNIKTTTCQRFIPISLQEYCILPGEAGPLLCPQQPTIVDHFPSSAPQNYSRVELIHPDGLPVSQLIPTGTLGLHWADRSSLWEDRSLLDDGESKCIAIFSIARKVQIADLQRKAQFRFFNAAIGWCVAVSLHATSCRIISCHDVRFRVPPPDFQVAGAAGGGNNYHPGGFAKYLGRGPKLEGDIVEPGFTMAHHGPPWPTSFIMESFIEEGPPFLVGQLEALKRASLVLGVQIG